MPKSSPYLQRNLVLDNGHLLVQVLKRSVLLQRIVHKELGRGRDAVGIHRKRTFYFPRNSIVQVNLKSKGHGKLSIHFAADQKTIETMFRIIAFANQLSLYGAVANMCEEFEFHQDRSGQPDVLTGQSIVLRQKFLCRMKSRHIRIFYCNNTKNESNCFHK